MKRLSRWSMAIVATFVLALSLIGGLAKQALADTTPVTSETELLAAIATAPTDGSQTIVQVNADFTITAPVQVPANKNIRLMGSGTITSAMTDPKHLFYMFKIASGGAVTLDGATIDGNNTAFAVENRGSFTLLRGVIKNGKAKPDFGNNGVVLTIGAGAKFVMAGGTIQDSTVDSALGGAVTVANGATGELRDGTIQNTTLTNQYSGSVMVRNADFTMTGGTITGGDASSISSSGGLMLYARDPKGETTTATMNGGYITNNKAVDGAGVHVYAGNPNFDDSKSKADFTFNGGSITNNVASESGGGIYVTWNGNVVMNNGIIKNNTAGIAGGGVATYDQFVGVVKGQKVPYSRVGAPWNNWPNIYRAGFTMNGGSIEQNKATSNGTNKLGDKGVGAGVYIASANVTLNAGEIINNTANDQGGAVYVASVPYVLHINNALIKDNTATVIGGGAWFCPTGVAEFHSKNGVAFFNNTANGAGDEIATVRGAGESAGATISDYMLGGASAHWTKDGAVTINLPSILGDADPAAARHTTEEVSSIVNNTDLLALESNPRHESINAAQNKAKLLIYGNTAQRGGGIGSNGTVITGEEGTQDVTVKKVWDTSANPDAVIPEKLTVYLVADGYRVDSVELSAANNWEHTFTGLPDNVTLTFEESAPTGWTAQTPEVNGNVTTLTNKADAPVTPTPTPEKPGKKRKHRTPYTGDASVVAMVSFATVGAGFVGVGAYARTRKDQ
ncbi:hypothetical protein HMPREF1492_0687 [Atopobium sp. BS2]|uniref:Cna B-type domain-containing protein n=1 Tax=Atopobium sp. BS2 TaxID=936550 RepID=UPI0004465051|nr:Cna B-type domain-containing protein [Atopobium sp. BS2]EWC91753.1 hypothetical protein HMPREF1492_0687 [Atopobium sp. BS2]